MAVLKKDELFAKIKERIGDDNSDEALSFIEDVTDTVNNYENNSNEDWKTKYEQNDKAWRDKYRERFFNDTNDKSDFDKDEPDEPKQLTFENLFKEG